MWYKYLDRRWDSLRIWRHCNLRFNSDEIGMLRNKHIGKLDDFLFRMARSEGPIRGSGLIFYFGLIGAVSFLKKTYYDPMHEQANAIQQRRIKDQNDKKARDILYYNKFGAPTRPTRSMNEFIAFINSSEAIDRNSQYLMYGLNVNPDQLAGLDSYTTENDERMIDILDDLKKRSGAH